MIKLVAVDLCKELTPHDERRAAVRAGVDPRTIRAFLAGKSQRSTVAARVRATLTELGFLPPEQEREGVPESSRISDRERHLRCLRGVLDDVEQGRLNLSSFAVEALHWALAELD